MILDIAIIAVGVLVFVVPELISSLRGPAARRRPRSAACSTASGNGSSASDGASRPSAASSSGRTAGYPGRLRLSLVRVPRYRHAAVAQDSARSNRGAPFGDGGSARGGR